MPLKKILFRPGVNRENTRYASESIGSINAGTGVMGGWYESDKVRFRAGTPEKIGGWARISAETFLGVCRSLWNWTTITGANLLGIGTNLKFYIEVGGAYNDVTPIRKGVSPMLGSSGTGNPFTTLINSATVTVYDANHGCITGDFVKFSNTTPVAGLSLNGTFQVSVLTANTYTITAPGLASGSVTGGGPYVNAIYYIDVGPAYQVPLIGWGAGAWGTGSWGNGNPDPSTLRIWSQQNFGQDLVYGYRGGPMYYWNAVIGYKVVAATITQANPGVLSAGISFYENMALTLDTDGRLPNNLSVGTIYYAVNVSGGTCNLALTPNGTAIDTSGSVASGQVYINPNGILINQLNGADADCPLVQNFIIISDTSRFVFAFGTNDYGSTVQDPMLIRWSDQESVTTWTPSANNQAGSVRLSHGSSIITAIQTRQEIVVFTDSSVYSLQYVGPPAIWQTQLLADNISILGQNAVAIASGVLYWMGVDKFYKYDGRVQTLRCDLRQHIFSNINNTQNQQVFAGTNEGFNEVWWFYCSENSTTVDKYVVYNYLEDIWYYGNMARTAWLDSGLRSYPVAATYVGNIVNHEQGNDDNVTGIPTPIYSVISSSEFDLEDGHNFGFVYRVLPDLTFRGSNGSSPPQVTMTLIPLQNSGAGYNTPQSEGGSSFASIQRIASAPVEEFTGQVFIRVRGRQMVFKVEGEQLGLQWQLGAPRIDIKPDGRRGNSG